MQYQEFLPSAPLRGIVKCLWWLETGPGNTSGEERILPDGCTELVLYRGNGIFDRVTADTTLHKGNNGALMGQATSFIKLLNRERVAIAGARFYPWGLYKLLGIPQYEIADMSIPLINIFGNMVNGLSDKVLHAPTHIDALHNIDDFLLKQFMKKESQPHLTETIAQTLIQTNGKQKIKDIAATCGYTQRHIEKQFKERIGISPKLFSDIIRLQHTTALLHRCTPKKLTELAHHSDFFDQSHFIRSFKELAGLTPREYLAEKHLLSDYLTKA